MEVKNLEKLIAGIKSLYGVDIKCIYWKVAQFIAPWRPKIESYARNNFAFTTDIRQIKNPGETLHVEIGTQFGYSLRDSPLNLRENLPRFGAVIGMSAFSHICGGMLLLKLENNAYRQIHDFKK